MKTPTLLLSAIALTIAQFSFGQKIFSVEEVGSKYTQNQILDALEAANLCGYVNPSENYLIKFDDGSTVRISSFQEIEMEGVSFDSSCVREKNIQERETTVWSISSNNVLRKGVIAPPRKTISGATRD